MGKGNKHRGGRDRDEGHDDKSFAQRSFGGKNNTERRFSGTIGAAVGQSGDHSVEHSAAMDNVKNVRQALGAQERALSANPDFSTYFRVRSEMWALEKKLGVLPEFAKYQADRREARNATRKMNEARATCKKCGFVEGVKASAPVAAQPIAQQAPAA